MLCRDVTRRLAAAAIVATSLISQRCSRAAEEWRTQSPDDRNAIAIRLGADGVPTYSVARDGEPVVFPSPVGCVCNDGDFSRDLAFVSASDEVKQRQHYELLTGPRSQIDHKLCRRTVSFRTTDGQAMHVDCAASDEGVAVRVRLAAGPAGPRTVQRETTAIRLARSSRAWLTPYHTAGPHTPNNEDYYFQVGVSEQPPESRAPADGWAMPALFLGGRGAASALVCESADAGAFCGCHLVLGNRPGEYGIAFARSDETHRAPPGVVYAPLPELSQPYALPWRVFVLGQPREIAASTLVNDLAPPSRIANTDWIRSGRASWSWLTQPKGPYRRELFDKFSRLAARYEWEYTTFDGGWWDVDLAEIAKYARERNVEPLAWMSSGDCFGAQQRRKKLDELRRAGVAGVKIDFWASELQIPLATIRDTLADAADLKLVVVLHGCPVPTGWQRTWPNLLSCEAVLGMEGYIYDAKYPEKAAELNCVLPFTRNVAGPMDATPCRISPLGPRRLTTAAHELATAFVQSSGIIHFADGPEVYEAFPDEAQSLLRDLPVRWDETRYLRGEPGRLVVVLRRSGRRVFVAALNGQNKPRKVSVDLKALGVVENDVAVIVEGAGSASNLRVDHLPSPQQLWERCVPPRGGFVLLAKSN
ncbi:MAG: glycoside hydrolase family 97 catalytic domain-containing protein [Pirellulales bacterium]|nr:glycoside hydrolase family 97 catalytic domain-containing protein [Pirellulales bacterium]